MGRDKHQGTVSVELPHSSKQILRLMSRAGKRPHTIDCWIEAVEQSPAVIYQNEVLPGGDGEIKPREIAHKATDGLGSRTSVFVRVKLASPIAIREPDYLRTTEDSRLCVATSRWFCLFVAIDLSK